MATFQNSLGTATGQTVGSNQQVWANWNTVYSATYTVTGSTTVWSAWNGQYVPTQVTGNANTNVIWGVWNQQYAGNQTLQGWDYAAPIERSAEQIAEDRRVAAAIVARNKKFEEDFQAARKRARRLLTALLSKKQLEQLEKENSFELQVNDRLYKIIPGQRVQRLHPTTKRVESSFCIHAENGHQLPPEDWAVGHKLLLESDEKEFLRIANETRHQYAA